MPFISTKASVTITKEQEQELVSRFGKALELINKSQVWLMLDFQDNLQSSFVRMFLRFWALRKAVFM